jgi:hypothetical protein
MNLPTFKLGSTITKKTTFPILLRDSLVFLCKAHVPIATEAVPSIVFISHLQKYTCTPSPTSDPQKENN